MEAGKSASIPKLEKVKIFGIAAVGGFIASLAIIGLILASETAENYPHGLFYTVIGNTFGVSGAGAMSTGLYLHIVAGTLIGIVAASPMVINRIYILMRHFEKRLLYGAIVGFLVWIFFFVPISYAEVAPAMERFGGGFLDVSGKLITPNEIMEKFPTIVISALGFHIQYGLIYAVIMGSFISHRMKVLSKSKLKDKSLNAGFRGSNSSAQNQNPDKG